MNKALEDAVRRAADIGNIKSSLDAEATRQEAGQNIQAV